MIPKRQVIAARHIEMQNSSKCFSSLAKSSVFLFKLFVEMPDAQQLVFFNSSPRFYEKLWCCHLSKCSMFKREDEKIKSPVILVGTKKNVGVFSCAGSFFQSHGLTTVAPHNGFCIKVVSPKNDEKASTCSVFSKKKRPFQVNLKEIPQILGTPWVFIHNG